MEVAEKNLLLQNLYQAAGIIKEAEDITAHYKEVKSSQKEYIEYVKVEDKLGTKVGNGIGTAVRWICNVVFVLFFLWLLLIWTIGGGSNEGTAGIFGVFAAIAIVVVIKRRIKKKARERRYAWENSQEAKRVEQQNEEIRAHNEVITKRINFINSQMKEIRDKADKYLSGWYPRNYCYSEAVKYFIDVIENYRADTLKEAINLYEEERRHREIANNQQEMLRQQQVNNVLTAVNLFTNMQTLDAVKDQTEFLRGVKEDFDYRMDIYENYNRFR